MRRSFIVPITAVLVLAATAVAVHAEPAKCRLAVLKASAGYARAALAIRQGCEESKLKGKPVACPDPAALAKAARKLEQAIAKGCGGKNKVCNAADVGADADDAPFAIGFSSVCPTYAGRTCGGTIIDALTWPVACAA